MTQVHISPEQAAAEMLRRRRARDSLTEYARSIEIPGTPCSPDPEEEAFRPIESALARHHIVTLEAIQRCMTTPNGRLIIMEPPGSAKSTYASVVGVSWYVSKFEGTEVIVTGYGDELPQKHSRRIRQIKRDPRERAIWANKPQLASDNKAVEQWALTNGSSVRAKGILSGITGNRANGVVIDDPVKGREAADSETIRNRTEEEYRDSVKTRLKPNGWIILIQTRWHEDDLAGRILPENYAGESGPIMCRDGQVWEVLNIPAKCERDDDPIGRKPGEYLWPEWFPVAHWQQFENDPRGIRTWNALYQQRPTAGDGIEFQRDWFQWYDPDVLPGLPGGRPLRLEIYGASDFATKEDRAADFTEHGIMGLDKHADIWILDWWYGQLTSDKYIAAWIALVRRWKPRRWWDEGNVIGNAIAPARNRAMREAKPTPVWVRTEQLTSIKNKALKLSSFQARAATCTVHLPLKRPWATRLVDQLCAFPAGRYDDAADVCGLFGRGIDKMMAAKEQSRETKPTLQPFTAAWLEHEETDERPLRYS